MERNITQIITDVTAEYDKTPQKINTGKCIELAQKVCRKHDDAVELSWKRMIPWMKYTTPAGKIFTGHAWIYLNNTHYDAEVPTGVNKFYELPYIQRRIDASQYQSPIEILRDSHENKPEIPDNNK